MIGMKFSHIFFAVIVILVCYIFHNSYVYESKKSDFKAVFDSIAKQNCILLTEIDSIETMSDSLLIKIDSLNSSKIKIKYVYEKEFKRLDSSSANDILREYYRVFSKHNIK
jgi:hypothetical protein